MIVWINVVVWMLFCLISVVLLFGCKIKLILFKIVLLLIFIVRFFIVKRLLLILCFVLKLINGYLWLDGIIFLSLILLSIFLCDVVCFDLEVLVEKWVMNFCNCLIFFFVLVLWFVSNLAVSLEDFF